LKIVAKGKTSTGMGRDAFFGTASVAPPAVDTAQPAAALQDGQKEEPAERRSFNLKPATLRLLDEIQIKTIRQGDKWTLSAIVERGIAMVAKEMNIDK
jgi:hypothetical protein